MSNIYEAVVEGNKLYWIGIPPKTANKKIKVKIILSEESDEELDRGKLMAEALTKISETSGVKSVKNPKAWQKINRKDREINR